MKTILLRHTNIHDNRRSRHYLPLGMRNHEMGIEPDNSIPKLSHSLYDCPNAVPMPGYRKTLFCHTHVSYAQHLLMINISKYLKCCFLQFHTMPPYCVTL